MKDSDWTNLKYFSKNENWGDRSIIDLRLVRELEKFREFINVAVVISCGTQGAHCANSHHYKGLAVDVVIPDPGKFNLVDFFFAAMRFDFYGVGIYPDWKCSGVKVPGLHLDIRQCDEESIARYRATWIGQGGHYLPVNSQTIGSLLRDNA